MVVIIKMAERSIHPFIDWVKSISHGWRVLWAIIVSIWVVTAIIYIIPTPWVGVPTVLTALLINVVLAINWLENS